MTNKHFFCANKTDAKNAHSEKHDKKKKGIIDDLANTNAVKEENDYHESLNLKSETNGSAPNMVGEEDIFQESDSSLHTGENLQIKRPFKCDECEKTFTHDSRLRKHKMVHTGEKPYVCNECKKRFPLAWRLNKHKMVCTGEKSYV